MNERNREKFDRLTSKQKAKLKSAMADFKRPEIVEARESARAMLERELAETGTIETEDDASLVAEFLAFRKFMGELRAVRESKGLSIEEVSRLSGLERRMISKLELGYNDNPTLKTITRYCRALGVAIAWQSVASVAS